LSTITFRTLGNGSEIGANSYLVGFDGQEVVLDCGIHPKKEGFEALPDFSPLDSAPLAVLVSHGHIDHCGALPCLLREYPATECYATQPTISIMDRMLHNSVSVMGTLALERGIPEYPLYSHGEVDHVIRHAYGLGFQREFALTWDSPLRASFHPSGHVLGSAGILLRIPGHTLFYTGDMCLAQQELMGGLALLDDSVRIDTLVIESTRGAHAKGSSITFEGEVARFARETRKVLERGGVALVPSFALGRSQELLNVISRLMRSEELPEVPVYASGLGRAIYEIYDKYQDYLKPGAELRPLYEFKRIGDVWEKSVRRDLLKRSCIIVATSGMMIENTPSAMIAQDIVRRRKHGIFFVGYLDPETLGYRLVHAAPGDALQFELGAHPVEVLLENRQQFSFSAHAHREDLRWLIEHVRPKNVVFVHGDEDAIRWMCENCSGNVLKHVPEPEETLLLEA